MALAAERVAIRDRRERDACRVERCRQPARDLAQTGLGLEEADDVDAPRRGLRSPHVRRGEPLGGLGALAHSRSAPWPDDPRRRRRALGIRRAPRCGRSRSSPGGAHQVGRSSGAFEGCHRWSIADRGPAYPQRSPRLREPHGQIDVLVAPPDEPPVVPVHRLEVGAGDTGAEPVGVAVRSEVGEPGPPGPAAVARREVAQSADLASPAGDERRRAPGPDRQRGRAAPCARALSPSCSRVLARNQPGTQPRRIAATK